MQTRNTVALAVAVMLSLFPLGCGRKKPPAPVPVKGYVRYANKKPAAAMVLFFHPLDDTNNSKSPSFALDKEGRFQDSILPGRYKATLLPIPVGSGNGPAGGADATPTKGPGGANEADPLKRYRDRERSPWEFVIPATGEDDLILTVK